MKARLYPFEGRMVTVQQLAAELPIYSDGWLRKALNDGCTSRMHLARRSHEARQRERKGQLVNGSKRWVGRSAKVAP